MAAEIYEYEVLFLAQQNTKHQIKHQTVSRVIYTGSIWVERLSYLIKISNSKLFTIKYNHNLIRGKDDANKMAKKRVQQTLWVFLSPFVYQMQGVNEEKKEKTLGIASVADEANEKNIYHAF